MRRNNGGGWQAITNKDPGMTSVADSSPSVEEEGGRFEGVTSCKDSLIRIFCAFRTPPITVPCCAMSSAGVVRCC